MWGRAGAAVLIVALCVCACGASAGRTASERDLTAYTGLGTWVDLYDPHTFAHPETAVAAMAKHGVTTLFLQTSNYQMPRDVMHPDKIARFVEAAHAEGMQVVAWYLPSFVNLARDQRRALAALRFKTPDGDRFDSFALDIESSIVKPATTRSARLVTLARKIRAAAPDVALGAIVPAPRGIQRLPWYWPGFPFAALSKDFDVFLPMGYFTYRSHSATFSGAYTLKNIALLRTWTGDPALAVHPIGGIAGYASSAQVRAFERAAQTGNAIGASLYDFSTTTAAQWRELQPARDFTAASTG